LKIAVIIPAAGSGKRFQASQPFAPESTRKNKTEADLAGRSVLIRTVELFVSRPEVQQVIVGVDPNGLADFRFKWGDKLGFHGVTIVAGGMTERWETVLNALQTVEDGPTHVAIHDAVRPLTSDRLIDRVFEAAQRYPAVIPVLPINGTLKETTDAKPSEDDPDDPLDAILGSAGKPQVNVKQVVRTVDRAHLVEAQTPQVFEIELMRRAYARITEGKIDPAAMTDDACLVEALGEPVHTVEGEPTNLKITRSQDLELAAMIVQTREHKKSSALGARRLFASDDED